MTIDLRRTVPLRIVDDLPDGDPATPGDAQPLVHTDGEPAGFIFACPGCGLLSAISYLDKHASAAASSDAL